MPKANDVIKPDAVGYCWARIERRRPDARPNWDWATYSDSCANQSRIGKLTCARHDYLEEQARTLNTEIIKRKESSNA